MPSPAPFSPFTACPCGSAQPYGGCCRRLHDGEPAATAEELMRSRYSAYVLALQDHLFRTWHPRTRPADLSVAQDVTWLGLEVVDTLAGGVDDDTGEVEFRATFEVNGGEQVLHERSRFERRAGRWVYVDGDVS